MPGATVESTPAHLGGHMGMSWTDGPVLDYLIVKYGINSMLDVGCGLGGMIQVALDRDVEAYGIDGDPYMQNERILIWDYTDGPTSFIVEGFDLIWCVEFVEHVESKYQDNFLTTFDAGRVLFMTAAYPGQGGHHHVNEQPTSYWIDILVKRGWALDQEATDWVRAHGEMPFSRMTGMVFTKIGQSS